MNAICNEEADAELKLSKNLLEEITGNEINGFCYPYGTLSAYAVTAARRHYDYACAIFSPEPENRWAIPRFFVGEDDGPVRLVAKIALRRWRERMHRGDL